jgi:surfeit locus 1 family protein
MEILLGRRWIWRHVFVAVVVGGCITAGFWQIARLHQREQHNALVISRERLAPAPLVSLTSPSPPASAGSLIYRRVSVRGVYDLDAEVVLFGRALDDTNGNDLLTPLRMGDGQVVVVDRGWVPAELDRLPVRQASPPAGSVTVTGVLFPPEAHGSGSPQTRVPGLSKIDLGKIGGQLGHSVLPVYIWLQRQEPAQPGSLPRFVPLPPLSNGPHFSYAVQWFLFALVGIVGYPIVLRRELSAHRRQGAGRDATEDGGAPTGPRPDLQ